jgi:O-antigen/teichoic acid export membrane protein
MLEDPPTRVPAVMDGSRSLSGPPPSAVTDEAPDAPTPTAGPPAGLRSSVLRGVLWMAASQSGTQVMAFLTSIAVAHLMSPRDVGIAAEAVVFATLTLVITDFGLGAVIVQRETLSDVDIDTAFWANCALGAVLTAMGIGLSWPIADLYGVHELQPLFAVLSFSFLFTGPGITVSKLLIRQLEFGKLQRRVLYAVFLSSATAVGLAAAGFGPWAIIAQSLVISGVATVLAWFASPWRPSMRFSWESLRGMMRFASHTFGANAVSWAQLNVDNFLVGRFVGAAPLGAYSIASSTSLTPLRRIAGPIGEVFFPAFSRLREPDRVAVAWLQSLQMVSLIVVPLTFGLVVIGQEFVLGLFGHKWHAAVTPLEVMAPIGLLQALGSQSTGVLSAIDRTQLLWRSTALLALASVASFAIGLPWGIDGVAIAYLAASVVLQPLYVHVTARAVGRTLWDVLRAISGLLQAGIAMVAATFGARELLLSAGLGILPRLAVLVVVGAVVYIAFVVWRAPDIMAQIFETLRRRRSAAQSGTEVPIDVAVGMPAASLVDVVGPGAAPALGPGGTPTPDV